MRDLDTRRAPGARLANVVVMAFVAFTAVQALQIRVRYYDTYDYLNDARAILGDEGPGAAYYQVHAPVMPLLATLGAIAHDPEDPGDPWSWLVPHVLAFSLTSLTLAALAAYLAGRHRGHGWAILGLALFVGSPFFVRYAPQLLVDIPTAGVVAASLALWDRVRKHGGWRWPVLLGGVWGVAMALKYSLLLLPGPFVLVALLEALVDRSVFSRRSARVMVAGVVGLGTFFGILAFTLERVDDAGFSLVRWVEGLQFASRMVQPMEGEGPTDIFVLATQIVSPVVLLLAAVGLPRSLRRWRSDLPGLLWLGLVLVTFTLSVGHNEGRYLYPVVPFILHLALLGIRVLWDLARTRRARELGRTVLSAALLTATVPGVMQMVEDRDPFFRRPTQQRVAELLVRELPPEGKVYWSNAFVVLAPPDPAPYARDEFFSFFHLAHPAIHFLTRRAVVGTRANDAEALLRRTPGEGDAFVVGALRFHHTTDLLTGHPLPPTFSIWVRARDDGEVRLEQHVFSSGDPSPPE